MARSTPGVAWWIPALGLAALLLMPLAQVWRLGPDLGHGWAAPILIAYLWWERWDQRPGLRAVASPSWWARSFWMVAILLALPLRLLLAPYPIWSGTVIPYTGLLLGSALIFAGGLAGWAGVKWVGGPCLVLLAALPWPGRFEHMLIMPVREGIAALVAEISNWAGYPAMAAGTSVRLTNQWVGIDEACGGIRSLQSTVMIALFFGEWLRLPWRRRVGLVFAAIAAAVLGNLGRVLVLTWCAYHGQLARWHDAAGWAALGFSWVVTGALAWIWRVRATVPHAGAASRAEARSAGVFVPRGWMGWALTLTVALAAIEVGTRWWFSREAAQPVARARWTVQLPETNPTLRREPLTDYARGKLMPDQFLSVAWIGSDQLRYNANYIVWEKGLVARWVPFEHSPTVCMPFAGCELVEELGVIDVRWAQGIIPFKVYIFRRMNEDLTVAFTIWDPLRGQPLREGDSIRGDQGWMEKWREVREARLDQPGQMLSFAINGRQDSARLQAALEKIIGPDGRRDE